MVVNFVITSTFNKKFSSNTIKQRNTPVLSRSNNHSAAASLMKVYFGRIKKPIIPELVINFDFGEQRKCIPVAKTTAIDKNNKIVDLFLVKIPSEDSASQIYVALNRLGKPLGYTNLLVIKGDSKYGRVNEQKNCNGYIKVNLMSTEGRKSSNKIYGIGKRLHQLAVEKSIEEGLGGRVRLHATGYSATQPEEFKIKHSFPFHYKCGFILEDPLISVRPDDWNDFSLFRKKKQERKKETIRKKYGDSLIEKSDKDGIWNAYYNMEKEYEETGFIDTSTSHDMYLPEENIEKLRNKDGSIEIFNEDLL